MGVAFFAARRTSASGSSASALGQLHARALRFVGGELRRGVMDVHGRGFFRDGLFRRSVAFDRSLIRGGGGGCRCVLAALVVRELGGLCIVVCGGRRRRFPRIGAPRRQRDAVGAVPGEEGGGLLAWRGG